MLTLRDVQGQLSPSHGNNCGGPARYSKVRIRKQNAYS